MDKTYLQVIAYYFAKPLMGDRVNEALTALAEATRHEPDNLSYAFFRSTEHDEQFVILETYRSANGLELHRETEHFKHIGIEIITPMLERKEVQRFMVQQEDLSAIKLL